MPNVYIAGHYTNQYDGTIQAGGTISQELDMPNETHYGFYGVFSVPGTLNFEVRPDATFDKATLVDGSGDPIAVTVSGTTAISGEVLKPLAPYRYVTVEVTPAQTDGALFRFITKA